MTQTMSIRIDSDAKKGLMDVCKELGITVSAAFNMFATKVAKERRIPFSLEVDPFYSKENMAHITKIIEEIESGKAKLVEHDLIEA
ncbi:MAG: type II toxin-antitoxin system RelB/DinJ family antitoxin [Bacilli bacterium]|nr:type II toxin-antitoxin system RelB/DinJ family antitoxin [Bacilli bacterium]